MSTALARSISRRELALPAPMREQARHLQHKARAENTMRAYLFPFLVAYA